MYFINTTTHKSLLISVILHHASRQDRYHQGRSLTRRDQETRRCYPRSHARKIQRSSSRSVRLNLLLTCHTSPNIIPSHPLSFPSHQQPTHTHPTYSYQIITQHEPYEMICEDTNLGFTRTDKLVFIQIFQQGRTAEQKQAIYAELAKRLASECGTGGEDLIVSCARNEREDWSFGMGRAQFLVGDL